MNYFVTNKTAIQKYYFKTDKRKRHTTLLIYIYIFTKKIIEDFMEKICMAHLAVGNSYSEYIVSGIINVHNK